MISDIVAERDVPAGMRSDRERWGECLAGAVTEKGLFDLALRAGFHGLTLLKRELYKEVDGLRFCSITVRGHKFVKGKECVYLGQTATYLGPFSSASDDDGHAYPRGQAVEVCTDTAAKLKAAPYVGRFLVMDPVGKTMNAPCCPSPPGVGGNGESCC